MPDATPMGEAAGRIHAAIEAEKDVCLALSGCDNGWLSDFVVMAMWTADDGRTWINRIKTTTTTEITVNGLLHEGLYNWHDDGDD